MVSIFKASGLLKPIALVWLILSTFCSQSFAHTSLRSEEEVVQGYRHLQSEINNARDMFQIEKAKYLDILTQEYGEYRDGIFQATVGNTTMPVGRLLFKDNDASWERTKRKMMIKILTAKIEDRHEPFVWSTGGHSSAAGHGNLFNESYTIILEKSMKPILASVGLDFVARPFAMGSTSSGMEIASCMKEVFGKDTDIISWDYGMTTGKSLDRMAMWGYRAALLPNRPPIIMLFAGKYTGIRDELVAQGIPILMMDDPTKSYGLTSKLPDSIGKTPEQLEEMPRGVRAFRCGNALEKDDPCGRLKYSVDPDKNEPCNSRKYRVSWHPGVKWHALYGHYLSQFLIEITDDALKAISDHSDPALLLKDLKDADDTDFNQFLSSDASKSSYLNQAASKIQDIPTDLIYKGQNLCHTAKLPSETRYRGILTESEIKGGPFSYDRGHELKEAMVLESTQLPVTYDKNLYQISCTKYQLQIDYLDFFLASESEGKLLLPNPTETSQYLTNEPLKGYIAICLALCGWGCPQTTIGWKQLGEEDHMEYLALSVNGEAVTSYDMFGDDCAFLAHSGGHKFAPNEDGKFEISAQSTASGKYARISAFVLW